MRKRRQSQNQNLKCVKAVVLGKDGVGKSALTVRYLTRRFIGEYDQTLESTYRHHLEVDNEFLYIDLMDTAGENTEAKLERCAVHGDMFLILYSIIDRSSFLEAERIASFVKERKNVDTALLILVGTKRDLEHFREVDESEGSDLAHQIDCPFYEISISECDGYKEVTQMLHGCLKAFLRRDKLIAEKQRSSLMKMKEGLIRKTGSLRKKSVTL